jgi:hypothetical protein
MSLLTAKPIGELALELLRRQIVLPALVSRIGSSDYTGSGGTVTLRVPVPRTAHEQATPGTQIDFDTIEEEKTDVKLKHWYDATILTDEDMTLSLVDYGRQVLAPQVASVAEAAENEIANCLNSIEIDDEIVWGTEPDPDADEDVLLAIREKLSDDDVPLTNRSVVVATDVARRLLKVKKFSQADTRGAAGLTALQAAELGEIYGMGIYESTAIDKGTAVGFHRSAFAYGNLSPIVPDSVFGASIADSGLALRVIRAFNANTLSTASVVSVFAGASVVEDDSEVKRAVLVAGEGGS